MIEIIFDSNVRILAVLWLSGAIYGTSYILGRVFDKEAVSDAEIVKSGLFWLFSIGVLAWILLIWLNLILRS